jgi:hypothetical protein
MVTLPRRSFTGFPVMPLQSLWRLESSTNCNSDKTPPFKSSNIGMILQPYVDFRL